MASFVYVRIHIHLIENKLSGKKHKSLTMRPNGALGNMKNCLYSWTRVHYNSTACLNLLFQLSWKENILKNQESKRNIVTNLPLSSSQSSIVSQLSIVYTFHPRTLFQTGVYFQLQICHFSFFVTQPSKSFIFHLSMNFLFRVYFSLSTKVFALGLSQNYYMQSAINIFYQFQLNFSLSVA